MLGQGRPGSQGRGHVLDLPVAACSSICRMRFLARSPRRRRHPLCSRPDKTNEEDGGMSRQGRVTTIALLLAQISAQCFAGCNAQNACNGGASVGCNGQSICEVVTNGVRCDGAFSGCVVGTGCSVQ